MAESFLNNDINNTEMINTDINDKIPEYETDKKASIVVENGANLSDASDIVETTLFADASTNPELDELIFKALRKIREYFFNNDIDEQKLADFMFKILTLNINDMAIGENKALNPEVLDQLVNQMVENQQDNESETFNDIIENIFGAETAKGICQKLGTEKVDEIVERVLGNDTKKMLCEKLERENLDELLNDLIDEKLKYDIDPEAKHPNFDEFFEKILGKDAEEFMKNKLENFVSTINISNPVEIVEIDDQES